MKISFPLSDVALYRVGVPRQVKDPLYADRFWQMNQQAFAMQVKGVASFYACHGREVEYAPAPGASQASVELYLNGSVYGAILHQRGILPLHGSSFVEQGRAVMLCGESGAGKSSLTAAFCLDGAEFLTDDVTPLVFEKEQPHILPLSDRIKLWRDCLAQLERDEQGLVPIWEGESKFYFPMEKGPQQSSALRQIFVIAVSDEGPLSHTPLAGVEAFTALRNEIYRWEYLPAMPESEKRYLQQLLELTKAVKVTRITRPKNIGVLEMKQILKHLILEL